MEKSQDPYLEMGYQSGLKIGQTLAEKEQKYVKEVNRSGHQEYEEGNRTKGVSIIMDSLRKGATPEEVCKKLSKQPRQSWTDNKNVALNYFNKIVRELESKTYSYWYGWLLIKEGDKYFLREASPAELCFSKFGEQSQLDNIPQESKGVFIKGWFDGLLYTIK